MKKIKRKMNKKGIELLGSHMINIIIAILALILIVYAGVKISGLFQDKGEKEKAELELVQLKAKLDSVLESGREDTYIVTSVEEWFIFSEEFGNLCDGDFCLCLCKEEDCSGESRACVSTESFALLRGKERNRELRFFQITPPFELKLGVSREKAYPFNAGESVDKGYVYIDAITPLFFKYENEWLWSPDLDVWMKISEGRVKSGKWKGLPPADENRDFLKNFGKVLEDEENKEDVGTSIFLKRGAKESNGVLIIGK